MSGRVKILLGELFGGDSATTFENSPAAVERH